MTACNLPYFPALQLFNFGFHGRFNFVFRETLFEEEYLDNEGSEYAEIESIRGVFN